MTGRGFRHHRRQAAVAGAAAAAGRRRGSVSGPRTDRKSRSPRNCRTQWPLRCSPDSSRSPWPNSSASPASPRVSCQRTSSPSNTASRSLWGWLTLLRPCRPSLRVEVEARACHLQQPPDRFARSAQWPRLPPLSSFLLLAADSLSAAAAAVAAAVVAVAAAVAACLLLATGEEYPEQDVRPVFVGLLIVPANASPSTAVGG